MGGGNRAQEWIRADSSKRISLQGRTPTACNIAAQGQRSGAAAERDPGIVINPYPKHPEGVQRNTGSVGAQWLEVRTDR